MKKYFLLVIVVALFSGCVTKRGISLRYYNECSEYYDLQGYYHKDCPESVVEFPEILQDNLEGKKVPTNDANERLF